MMGQGFWDDVERSQKVNQRLAGLKERVGTFTGLESAYQDLAVMLELCEGEKDPLLEDELTSGLAELAKRVDEMELEVLLAGPYDRADAILPFILERVELSPRIGPDAAAHVYTLL
ncbi:hypothetical protein N752_00510 [Desulforamulus aquiferis]|nr:hypothetical protein N752_00510 [Desulforamulus aquiferis]